MSANPTMLRKLVRDLEKIDQSLGNGKKSRLIEEEKPLIKMIKSPYTNKISSGTTQIIVILFSKFLSLV